MAMSEAEDNKTELEKRVAALEKRIAMMENYNPPPQSTKKVVWIMLAVILGIFLAMAGIGIIQFVSSG
ncbi:hypothetical protein [Paenibacillus sp. FSL R10-2736]|uniref:hypothetical protein n=1 Tax=Paenibacillus sp. FSL R10-2736 TaxID=2954692 RepID=UPI0030FCB150